MGFYLRKSVRVGPLRFNLSGSGIGLSCGIPGLRIGTGPRGNYIHAGRGGFYYRKTFSAGKTHSFGTDQPNQQPTYQTDTVDPTLGQLEPVDAGTSALMQDTSSQSLLDELNEKHRRLRLWPWILLLAIATVATAIYLGLPALIIGLVTCAGAVAVILSTYRDTLKKTTVLLYDFDDDALGAFANLDGAFNQANASQCIWHVQSKAAVARPQIPCGCVFGDRYGQDTTVQVCAARGENQYFAHGHSAWAKEALFFAGSGSIT